ncbi:MAG TPA: AFG1/ZapE family ATPase [Armatimonadota bacterium]
MADFAALGFSSIPVVPKAVSPNRPDTWLCQHPRLASDLTPQEFVAFREWTEEQQTAYLAAGCRREWYDGGSNWLRHQCPHELEDARRQSARQEAQRRQTLEAREASEAAQLRLDSRISRLLSGCSFSNFALEAEAWLPIVEGFRRMADRPHGALYLSGPVGTGKSHLAAAACNAVLDRGQRALMRFSHELFRELFEEARSAERGRGERPLLDSLTRARLVVLDDFALVKPKALESDHLLEILQARASYGGGLIITSNIAWRDLAQRYGDAGPAIRSRLGGLCLGTDGTPRYYTVPQGTRDHRLSPNQEDSHA